jgi:hypothetical protein
MGAAAFTGFLVPWELGFCGPTDLYNLKDVICLLDLGLVGFFIADIGK